MLPHLKLSITIFLLIFMCFEHTVSAAADDPDIFGEVGIGILGLGDHSDDEAQKSEEEDDDARDSKIKIRTFSEEIPIQKSHQEKSLELYRNDFSTLYQEFCRSHFLTGESTKHTLITLLKKIKEDCGEEATSNLLGTIPASYGIAESQQRKTFLGWFNQFK